MFQQVSNLVVSCLVDSEPTFSEKLTCFHFQFTSLCLLYFTSLGSMASIMETLFTVLTLVVVIVFRNETDD